MQDSLFGANPHADAAAAHFPISEYKKLLEKDKRLELHAITLSDYWREDIIPRGLRIKKFPTLGKDDAEFRHKWEAILNKCSFDLILLLIEEIKKQRTEVRHQLEEVKPNIEATALTDSSLAEQLQKLRDEIESFSNTLKHNKMEKFKRDRTDYRQGAVYLWPQTRSHPPKRRGRTVSFSLPSSTSASEDEENTAGTSRQHFLEQTGEPSGPRRRGGGGRGGGGDARPPRLYPLRSKQAPPTMRRQ